MAPEQVEARHDEVGPATDVYSMGIMLYELVAGRRPYSGSIASIFEQIASREPEPPSAHSALIPKIVDAICMKAISKSPQDRQQSAKEFADELQNYLDEVESQNQIATVHLASDMFVSRMHLFVADAQRRPGKLDEAQVKIENGFAHQTKSASGTVKLIFVDYRRRSSSRRETRTVLK